MAKKINAVKPAVLGSRQPTSIEDICMSFPFRHVQQSVNCIDVITIFLCLCVHFCSSLLFRSSLSFVISFIYANIILYFYHFLYLSLIRPQFSYTVFLPSLYVCLPLFLHRFTRPLLSFPYLVCSCDIYLINYHYQGTKFYLSPLPFSQTICGPTSIIRRHQIIRPRARHRRSTRHTADTISIVRGIRNI